MPALKTAVTPLRVTSLLLAALFLNLAHSTAAHAIPPPDIIFSAVSNLGIVFSFVTAFLVGVYTSLHMYLGTLLHTVKGRVILSTSFVLLCTGITFGIHSYQVWQQEKAYAEWVAQSSQVEAIEVEEESPSPSPSPSTTPSPEDTSFFESQRQLPLSVSNLEFSDILATKTPFVLDAREDEEHRYGSFPGSTHIRFADIKAGAWQQLPKDRAVYVLCWSGIRGKEVAEFLFFHNIAARYLEKGADGWVSSGGTWNGEIKFEKAHPEERFRLVLTTDQLESALKDEVVIVDSRPKATYTKWHIPGSVSLPIIYTPTSEMSQAFAQIPLGSKVITVCDDFVSCFDARLVGLKAEEDRQATFLGRYAKPWEYRAQHP
ncbi:MAG TPA: rhodanese-like domain-containing protein [Verrucomicrobiae bacterium]|nr:rhodanese-like domain-containing protein [Verrucomicrobiae bacterium]